MRHLDTGHNRPYGRQFIDLAGRGINSGRSYVFAMLLIVLCPLAFAALLGLAAGAAGTFGGQIPGWFGPALGIIGQFGSVVIAGGTLVWAVRHWHRRPWLS